MTPLQIEYRNPASLAPATANARTHSDKQIQEIAKSIAAFGFNNPILIDESDRIVAGHGRALAALQLGLTSVPTVRLDHMTAAQKRAYVIADNRLAELAGWDPEILSIELQGLLEMDLDFDITTTGFEMPAIEALVVETPGDKPDPADAPVAANMLNEIARLGDLWLLGKHVLFCGDALDPDSYRALLAKDRAGLVFTDPPYNVPIHGHVSGKGKVRHREFAMAAGEMSEEQFTTFLTRSLSECANVSVAGAIHYVCMDWRHLDQLLLAGKKIYADLLNLCVWVKRNGGMGSLYRSQHELIAVFKLDGARHTNNVQLGRHGRNRTNVWSYPGTNSFQTSRDAALAMHPTIKPVQLVADAILDCSVRGDIVLDPFGGSGTTILAAERVGRRAYVIELDPRYVDLSLYRFVSATGQPAIHAATGIAVTKESFGEPVIAANTSDAVGSMRHG